VPAPRYLVKYRLEKKPNRDRPDQTIERSRIVLGSRPLADVYVPDRLVPHEALELVFDGRRLEIEVKGRLAGVFVNGSPAEGTGPVPHGAAIQVGACLVEVAIDANEAVCTLTVGERHLTATVAAIGKKAAQPFALEDDGPQEQRWGRTQVLKRWNWIAAAAGLLCLAAFPFAKDTEALNRGTLVRAHTIGAEKGPESCASCHDPFSSDYGPKCEKCHEGFDSERTHPFAAVRDTACSHCHPEHRGADADAMPPMTVGASGWPRTCEGCHAGQDRAALAKASASRPDAASRARDRAGDAVNRWLQVDGFAHSDHRVAKPRRASLVGGAKAPQGDVPIPCAKCHEQRASKDVAGATPDAEFALVAYEKCLDCHAEWRVDVHGRDQEGVHCFQCHAKTGDLAKIARDIRTVEVAVTGSVYEVVPRRHDFAKDDCRSCHVEEKAAAQRTKPERMTFRHDHHLRTVRPEKGGELSLAASCVPCHVTVAESSSLAGLGETLGSVKLDGCKDCHTEGAPQPVPGTGRRTVVDMFHSVHTVEPGTSGALRRLANRETLAKGCLACHVPSEGAKPMALAQGVADCSACHKGHESLGGGRCALCHVDRRLPENRDAKGALTYRFNEAGIFNHEKAVLKATAPVRSFDHFSAGHAADAREPTGAGCAKCHDAASVDRAERVADVPWPGAVDASCIECHAAERYHR
jgi:hypothetical protein